MAHFEVSEPTPMDVSTFSVRSLSRGQKIMDFISSHGVEVASPQALGLASTVTNGAPVGFTTRQEAMNVYQAPRVVKDLFINLSQALGVEFGSRKDYGSPDIQERMNVLFSDFKAVHPELPLVEETTDGHTSF